jgi:hypothetical protein
LGLSSVYIQYFPPQLKLRPIPEIKVFFWQRSSKININLVEKLLGDTPATIHFHRATDPNTTLIQPTPAQEEKYKITYSDWFTTRKEYHQILQTCNVFIAPREFEGIGLSYLEAMSMGLAIVAPNNPTMNEYIIHNKTGYLYDLSDPNSISFSNLTKVRINTRRYFKKGVLKWSRYLQSIIKLINS